MLKTVTVPYPFAGRKPSEPGLKNGFVQYCNAGVYEDFNILYKYIFAPSGKKDVLLHLDFELKESKSSIKIEKINKPKNKKKMKKVLFAMAIAAMFGFVACNNNKTEEPAQDTAAVEAAACCEEQTASDTATVENMVEEVVSDAVEAAVAE